MEDSRFIHVDSAVAMAMTLIPKDSVLDKAIARHWAYAALKNIGPTEHWFVERELIPNSNLSVKKPIDFHKAIDIALIKRTGSTDTEYKFSYKGLGKRIHSDGNTVREAGVYSPESGAPIDLSEDAYCFHLGSNGAAINVVKLKYWRLPIGEDGLPLIPEVQELAVALFIRWMWAIKENVANDRALSKADFYAARTEARNSSKMPSGIEMEQVGKEWTSLLNSPRFKQF